MGDQLTALVMALATAPMAMVAATQQADMVGMVPEACTAGAMGAWAALTAAMEILIVVDMEAMEATEVPWALGATAGDMAEGP